MGEVNDADQTSCARGTLVRFSDHTPGQNVDDTPTPGPSTFVKRQIREQMRLDSQREKSLCPMAGKACLVGLGKDSWECVDVETELGTFPLCLQVLWLTIRILRWMHVWRVHEWICQGRC